MMVSVAGKQLPEITCLITYLCRRNVECECVSVNVECNHSWTDYQ